MSQILNREINLWFRRNPTPFPRSVNLKQFTVDNMDAFNEYIKNQGAVDCYSAIFSNEQIANKKYDTIFLDIDAHDGNLLAARDKKDKVMEILEGRGYAISRMYFTGRGFHIYLDIKEITLDNYAAIRKQFILSVGLKEYIDTNTADTKRLARLPGTINSNNGMRCGRIGTGWDIDRVVGASKEGKVYYNDIELNDGIEKELKELDILGVTEEGGSFITGTYEDQYQALERTPVFQNNKEIKDFPKCVRKMIEELITTRQLNHDQRTGLASFLVRVWGIEKTHELIKTYADDYKEGVTTYQLQYISTRHHKFYKCKRVDEMGYCPFKEKRECAFSLASESWVEKLLPLYDR